MEIKSLLIDFKRTCVSGLIRWGMDGLNRGEGDFDSRAPISTIIDL